MDEEDPLGGPRVIVWVAGAVLFWITAAAAAVWWLFRDVPAPGVGDGWL